MMPTVKTRKRFKAFMRVFIVEGSEIIRSRLAFLFSEIDWVEQVSQAKSVKDAMENILRLRPDVVLIDIKLPDGNGLDLLAEMQVQGVESKAIIMTFSPHPQYRKRAMELGAFGFIDKATELGSIRSILGKLVVGHA